MYRGRFPVECLCCVIKEHTKGGFLTVRGYRAAISRPLASRHVRDRQLLDEIRRIHSENYGVYGVRKMWHAIRRAGWEIGRDHTARLMRRAGVSGVRRGRHPITTRLVPAADSRPDWCSVTSAPMARTGATRSTKTPTKPATPSSMRTTVRHSHAKQASKPTSRQRQPNMRP